MKTIFTIEQLLSYKGDLKQFIADESERLTGNKIIVLENNSEKDQYLANNSESLSKGDKIYIKDSGKSYNYTGETDENGDKIITESINDGVSKTSKEYILDGTTLGALSEGDIIPVGTDLDSLLELITKKIVLPTLNISGGGNYESGTTISPKLTISFNQYDGGPLSKIILYKNGEVNDSSSISPFTYSEESFIITDETITYKAIAEYEGTDRISAGSLEKSVNYSGKRKLFYGTGSTDIGEIDIDSVFIRDLDNSKLNPSQGYQFNINVSKGDKYIIFAYPSTIRDVSKVRYEQQNDDNAVTDFNKILVDVSDARGNGSGLREYKVYYYIMNVPAVSDMTYVVTL